MWLVLLFLRYRAAAENVRVGPTVNSGFIASGHSSTTILLFTLSVILLNFQTVVVTLSLKWKLENKYLGPKILIKSLLTDIGKLWWRQSKGEMFPFAPEIATSDFCGSEYTNSWHA